MYMKNIISKKDLLKKIRGKENKEEEVEEIIIGTFKMSPCKPLSYIRLVSPSPKIEVDSEIYPENITPGIYITGANRVYQISEVNRSKGLVKAILLGYDESKCMYSFTIGNTHEFKMEEFTSEFWTKYYKWRRANKDELIQHNPSSIYLYPSSVIYDFRDDGYFRFLDFVEMRQIGTNGEYFPVLKAYLLYSDNQDTREAFKDTLKGYTRAPIICSTILKSPQPISLNIDYRPVNDKEYLELVTGVRDLEIEKSENPTTPMNLILNCLSGTSTFRVDDKTHYITRLNETEVKCIEITSDYKVIHHAFSLNNLISIMDK